MSKQKGRKAIEKKNQVLERLKIEYVGVDQVKPNSYNPNRQSEHDFELLVRSMREDGFTQPVLVLKDLTIVDGEHRWRAAKELGITEIPVVRVDMTAEQMRISTLRHNKARGSHDVEMEAQVLRDLRELGALDWAQDSLMISDIEMQRLLEDIPAPEALESEEFTEAWNPAPDDRQGDNSVQGVPIRQDMTPEASDALRSAEKKIAKAKTEEERRQALKDADIFRLSVTFTGEQAKTVRAALGSSPASALLRLCGGKA